MAGITTDLQGTLNPRVWSRCNYTCIEPLQIIDDLWAFVSSFKTWGIIFFFPLQFWNSNLLGRFLDPEILPETNYGKTFCLQSWKQFLKYEVPFWFNEMLFGGGGDFLPDPSQLIPSLHPFPHPEVRFSRPQWEEHKYSQPELVLCFNL